VICCSFTVHAAGAPAGADVDQAIVPPVIAMRRTPPRTPKLPVTCTHAVTEVAESGGPACAAAPGANIKLVPASTAMLENNRAEIFMGAVSFPYCLST
jgi:hypothetical protein